MARCGRFLKAQKEFLNEGVSSDTPREEHYFLSQKDPQPAGRQILIDSVIVANPVTARNGAAPGVCSSCPLVALGRRGMPALHNLLSRAICQFLEVPFSLYFVIGHSVFDIGYSSQWNQGDGKAFRQNRIFLPLALTFILCYHIDITKCYQGGSTCH